MRQIIQGICVLLAATIFVSACVSSKFQPSEDVHSTKCPELRPEMCTMDYNPVCGRFSGGSFKSFSNGCNACSDPKIVSYIPGECK
jgi:hypothetical protein